MPPTTRYRELPVDQGWSWVICFACFTCMFMVGISLQALSVLFLELVNEFESSITVTSLSVMCFVMSISVSSVVSTSVLVPAFGERPVVIVAGALFSACSLGYFLAPNIMFFLAFACGKGFCVGLIYVPSVSLLSYYFDKRRSIATTISNSGICVASIVSPPIIRAIAAEYGMRQTFLILSAIEFHMVAAGLLMRPVSSYRAVSRDITGLTDLDKDIASVKDDPAKEKQPEQRFLPSSSTYDLKIESPVDATAKYSNRRLYDRIDTCTSYALLEDARFYDKGNELSNVELVRPSSYLTNMNTYQPHTGRHTPMKDSLQRHRKDPGHQLSTQSSYWSIDWKYQRDSVRRDSVRTIASELEPAVSGVALYGEHAEDDIEDNKGWRSCCCVRIIMTIFDPALYRQLAFRAFLISSVPSATTHYLTQYLPTIAVIKGASKDQAATLPTITGSVDLVSRLAVGFFADTHLLRASHIVAIAQICEGILLQFNTLFDNYEKMITMVVIMGLFIGTRGSLLPMMHIEIVGMEKMARCLSITAMLATISAASHSPLLSAILEARGSYDIVLYYVGVALIVGAIIMLFMPLLAKIDARREARRQARDTAA